MRQIGMIGENGRYTLKVDGSEVALTPGTTPFSHHVYRDGRYQGLVAVLDAVTYERPCSYYAISVKHKYREFFSRSNEAILALIRLNEDEEVAA